MSLTHKQLGRAASAARIENRRLLAGLLGVIARLACPR